MRYSRVAFAFMLILAVVPVISIMPSQVLSQSYVTITTQVTTTELNTYPVATQYTSYTETSYVYGPENFTLLGGASVCWNWQARFDGTQGQQFHVQWTTKTQVFSPLDFYIATPSAVNAQWSCSSGPEALYSSSGSTGSVDWVAPSTGQFIALLVNPNISTVSGTLSIETHSIKTVTSISYATATTTNLVTTGQIVTASSPLGNFGIVVLVVLIGAFAGSFMVFMKRRKTPPPTISAKPELTPPAQLLEETPPPAPPPPAPIANEVVESHPEKPTVVLPEVGPIPTGYTELDQMLSGGLPKRYAVLFASPSYDERDLLLGKIIESNLSSGSPSFYVSGDIRKMEDLLGKYHDNFYAFCPQADKAATGHRNLFNVANVQNLSDFNISLNTTLRGIPVGQAARKIMIIDLLSDILLQHKLLTTRRWLSDFLTKRKADGFTILATFNPLIAAREEAQTIIDSFDGVIEIYEKELKERSRRFLTIKKMYGLRYSETELMLDKNKLY